MKKIRKFKEIISDNGFLYLLKFIFKKIILKIGDQIFWSKNKRLIKKVTNNKNVIIISKTIEWNYAFQRTQQLATQFSKMENFCVIYVTKPTVHYDFFINIKKINDSLFCYSYKHYKMLDELLSSSKTKTLYITNLLNYENDIEISYDKMVYEYIDELSLWFKDNMEVGLKKHHSAIENADVVVATATKLFDEVKKYTEKCILCENAGDYDFFSKIDKYKCNEIVENISEHYDCVLGYYGMLAEWFDFELVKQIAKNNKNWAWILIGPTYPNYDLDQHHLEQFDNIYILGPKPYKDLPSYVKGMDILTIPFKLNEITASTSPVKLFEYMAMSKPIITSNMKECRRYKSVNIYNSAINFIQIIKKINSMSTQEKFKYYNLLKKDATANTWKQRADMIIKALNL